MTNSLDDLGEADVFFVIGANPADQHPIIFRSYLLPALKAGTKLVHVDPRASATTKAADIHLPVRPGYDIPLLNALAAVVVEEDLVDEAFVADRTEGFDAYREFLAAVDVDAAAEQAGVDPADLREDRQRLQDHREDRDRQPRHVGLGAFADSLDLTEEQKAELRETAHEARADGAYPAEVKTAVLDQLRAFGYTDAEIRGALLDGRVAALQHRHDLTDEQAAEVRATVVELREDGAFHVEVRAAVVDLLQEYGSIPEAFPRDRFDRPDRPADATPPAR
jgi:DNA-binding transcriptional MerR regulator